MTHFELGPASIGAVAKSEARDPFRARGVAAALAALYQHMRCVCFVALFQRAPVDAFCIVLLRLSCSVRPILPRKDLVPNRSNACFGQVFNLEIHSNTEQTTICHSADSIAFPFPKGGGEKSVIGKLWG